MIDSKKATLGRLAILATTLIWGTSFVILKSTLESVSTMYVLAIRFLGASVLMLLIGCRELKKLDKGYFIGGIGMGVFLFIAYMFQTYGLTYTTPGKNAFLTSTYCIITPFLYWLIMRRKPDRYNVIAAVICIVGMALISLEGDMSIGLGDGLTIICGLFFALHIIVTDHSVAGRSVVLLTMLQFATAGILSLCGALLFESAPTNVPVSAWLSILYLCIMCTAVCYILQTFGQKYTPASQSAVILTLESVFGAVISIAVGEENVTLKLIVGFVLTFFAVILSETKLGFLKLGRKGDINE